MLHCRSLHLVTTHLFYPFIFSAEKKPVTTQCCSTDHVTWTLNHVFDGQPQQHGAVDFDKKGHRCLQSSSGLT